MKTYLDPTLVKRLKKHGLRRCLRALIPALLWWAAVVTAWLCFQRYSDGGRTEVTATFVILLLILPFWPFGLLKKLIGTTYYAEVTGVRYAQQRKNSIFLPSRTEARNAEIEVAVVTLKTDSGDIKQLVFTEDGLFKKEMYYKPGDRVLKIHGLKFPIKCPLPEDEPTVCPRCGNFIRPEQDRCGWCRLKLSD